MKILFFAVMALPLFASELIIQMETGAVWQHRNDVKISPATGDLLSFDEFDQGPFLHYRSDIYWNFGKRQGIRVVLAPFSISVKGESPTNVVFNGESFLANQELTVEYMFNSYRLGYYYSILKGKSYYLNLGLTGKIRHAEIKFKQGALSSSYDNLGFVPLFYLGYAQKLSEKLSLSFDADFAAAPQGRAFDLALKMRYQLSPRLSAGIGYRTLEGGAENDKVLTFSWFNYWVTDLRITL